MLSEVCFRIDGTQKGSEAGVAVAGGSDVDGDGYDDILIGAPRWTDRDYADSGAVGLFYGGPGL